MRINQLKRFANSYQYSIICLSVDNRYGVRAAVCPESSINSLVSDTSLAYLIHVKDLLLLNCLLLQAIYYTKGVFYLGDR